MQPTFSEKILFVDDDPHLLEAMRRQFRRQFTIALAGGGEEALEVIEEEGPFAVVVSDRSMPGMNGVELLGKIRLKAPETVRVMLTGDTHLQAAMGAVNEGQIFRFLTKPCERENIRMTLEAGIEHYRLITSQKVLLSKTLRGSVNLLMDVLSLHGEGDYRDLTQLKPLVKSIAEELKVTPAWEIEIATMLSAIGFVTVPPRILQKVKAMKKLLPDEQEIYSQHAQVGADLITNIPRLENVAKIVKYQLKNYDGSGFPFDVCDGQEIPIGSRILHVATEYDRWIRCGLTPEGAFARVNNFTKFDPLVVEALEKIVSTNVESQSASSKSRLRLIELTSGMVLASDIRTKDGSTLVVPKGQELTKMLLQRVRNFHSQKPLIDAVEVFVESKPEEVCNV